MIHTDWPSVMIVITILLGLAKWLRRTCKRYLQAEIKEE